MEKRGDSDSSIGDAKIECNFMGVFASFAPLRSLGIVDLYTSSLINLNWRLVGCPVLARGLIHLGGDGV